jgi:hypothetical protein
MENTSIFGAILRNLFTFAPDNNKVRWGREADGGYVVVGGYEYDYFISAGIANETTFEEDFIRSNPNTPGIAFDGTVERSGTLPSKLEYVKNNIDAFNSDTTTNLIDYLKDYKDIFLKFDIEGEEWNWIPSFKDHFHKCKQIVFEAHAIFPDGIPPDRAYYRSHLYKTDASIGRVPVSEEQWIQNVLNSLQILNKTHRLVHAHQNADGPFLDYENNKYPSFLELTFLRKDCKVNGLNQESLPVSGLDFVCGRTDPDMLLGGSNYDPTFCDRDMSFYPFKF